MKKKLQEIDRALCSVACELNGQGENLHLWEQLNNAILSLETVINRVQEGGQILKDYILVRQEYENGPVTVEGFFHTKKQAKEYIKELEAAPDEFSLYELKHPFDELQ